MGIAMHVVYRGPDSSYGRVSTDRCRAAPDARNLLKLWATSSRKYPVPDRCMSVLQRTFTKGDALPLDVLRQYDFAFGLVSEVLTSQRPFVGLAELPPEIDIDNSAGVLNAE